MPKQALQAQPALSPARAFWRVLIPPGLMAGMMDAAVCSLQSRVVCNNKQGKAHAARVAAWAEKTDIS